MHKKSILRNLLSVIPTLGMGFLLVPCVSSVAPTSVKASNDLDTISQTYSSGVEVQKEDELKASLISSTLTSTSHSFNFSFRTGAEGFQNTSKSYIIAVNDSTGTFDSFIADVNKMTADERTEYGKKVANGEIAPNEFDGYIIGIQNGNKNDEARKNIIIPKTFTRNRIFDITPRTIDAYAVDSWDSITSITIPSNITSVSSDSFAGAPTGTIFNIEHTTAVPEGWDEDWLPTGAVLNTGYDYEGLCPANDKNAKYTNAKSYGDDSKNYILGYYPTEGEITPLVAEYKLEGDTTVKYEEFKLQTSNACYNSVGSKISKNSQFLSIDIPITAGQKVDLDSVVIRNIYRNTKDVNNNIVPDTDAGSLYIYPTVSATKTYSLDEFLSYEFKQVSNFCGYMALSLNIDINKELNIYSQLNKSYYTNNLKNIESGKYVIRYRLTSLNSCSFNVTYKVGDTSKTQHIDISTPVPYYNFGGTHNNVVFLLNMNSLGGDFNINNITKFEFNGLYVTLDLFIPENNAIVARSNVTTRFGNVVFLDNTDLPISHFDIDLFLIIFALVYVAVYVTCAILLHNYLKNKFKNDEFRRMNTQKFAISASLGLGGLGVVLYALVFIVLRFTLLSNTIVVFNPIDAFIIVTGIASVLIIGYFIKNMVTRIKAEKQRRLTIKLNLDKDAFNDGTK